MEVISRLDLYMILSMSEDVISVTCGHIHSYNIKMHATLIFPTNNYCSNLIFKYVNYLRSGDMQCEVLVYNEYI